MPLYPIQKILEPLTNPPPPKKVRGAQRSDSRILWQYYQRNYFKLLVTKEALQAKSYGQCHNNNASLLARLHELKSFRYQFP